MILFCFIDRWVRLKFYLRNYRTAHPVLLWVEDLLLGNRRMYLVSFEYAFEGNVWDVEREFRDIFESIIFLYNDVFLCIVRISLKKKTTTTNSIRVSKENLTGFSSPSSSSLLINNWIHSCKVVDDFSLKKQIQSSIHSSKNTLFTRGRGNDRSQNMSNVTDL